MAVILNCASGRVTKVMPTGGSMKRRGAVKPSVQCPAIVLTSLSELPISDASLRLVRRHDSGMTFMIVASLCAAHARTLAR